MISEIIKLLPLSKYGDNETIDRAKGKYKMPSNFKELKKYIKDERYKSR